MAGALTGADLESLDKYLGPYIVHAGECMVERIEDGCDGQRAVIVFNEERHPLRDLVKTSSGRQRKVVLHCQFIEMDNDGNPINKEREAQLEAAEQKGGEYCAAFHMLIQDVDFHRYLFKCAGMKDLANLTENGRREAVETHLRTTLFPDGESSRMLDHDDELRARFRAMYLRPFNEWKAERGQGKRHDTDSASS